MEGRRCHTLTAMAGITMAMVDMVTEVMEAMATAMAMATEVMEAIEVAMPMGMVTDMADMGALDMWALEEESTKGYKCCREH